MGNLVKGRNEWCLNEVHTFPLSPSSFFTISVTICRVLWYYPTPANMNWIPSICIDAGWIELQSTKASKTHSCKVFSKSLQIHLFHICDALKMTLNVILSLFPCLTLFPLSWSTKSFLPDECTSLKQQALKTSLFTDTIIVLLVTSITFH